MLESSDNSIGVLAGLLQNLDKRLLLQLTSQLPNYHADMLLDTPFAEPVSIDFLEQCLLPCLVAKTAVGALSKTLWPALRVRAPLSTSHKRYLSS